MKGLKKILHFFLWLLIGLSVFYPNDGHTSGSGLHSVTIRNTSLKKRFRDDYFYMYFPNSLSGTFDYPDNNQYGYKHYANKPSDMVIYNYPIELSYHFTCRKLLSKEHHDNDTTLVFQVYDKKGTAGSVLKKVKNWDGGTRIGSVTIPAQKGVRVEYFTGKFHKNIITGMVEKLNAYKGTVEITYRTDEIPPPVPKNIRITREYPGSGEPYTKVSWDPVTDKGNPASGVEKYVLSANGQEVTVDENFYNDIDKTLFSKDGQHGLRIYVYDYAGHSSFTDYSFILDTTAPTGEVRIDNNSGYTNNKQVNLLLSAVDDLSGISRMRVKNDDEEYGEWEDYNSQKEWILPDGDGLKKVYVQFKDGVGNISEEYHDAIILDTTAPTGSLSVESEDFIARNGARYINTRGPILLQISAEDNISTTADLKMQFSNDNITYSALEDFKEVRNGWFLGEDDGEKKVYVRFTDQAGNASDQEGILIFDTLVLDRTGPRGEFRINNGAEYTNDLGVTLQLEADDGSGIGLSEMCFSNDGINYSPWETYTTEKAWDLSQGSGISGNGPKEVWAWFRDYFNQESTAVSRVITYDTMAPTCSFVFKPLNAPSGEDEYDEQNPTNSPDIVVSNIAFNDHNEVDSGIKEFCVWNGTAAEEPEIKLFFNEVTEVIAGVRQIKTEKKEEIKSGAAGICYVLSDPTAETGPPVPWTFCDEDGLKSVSMKVYDQAGNAHVVTKKLSLDTTAPTAIESFSHTPTEFTKGTTHNKVTVSWRAQDVDQDIAGFVGVYIVNETETPLSDLEMTTEGSLAIGQKTFDLSGLLPNQTIELRVSAIDRAGNTGEVRTYIVAKKAELGTIEDLDGGYDESTEAHYLSWRLSAPGIAAGHMLQRVSAEASGEVQVLANIYPDSNGVFTDTGLNRRTKYLYRLVALNAANDRTYEEIIERSVPNVAPTAPIPLFPQEYARSTVEFNFTAAIDYDGDPITYTVKIGEGENPVSFDEAEIKEGTFSKDGLVHGRTYTWYVIADDGFEGGKRESARISFVVDTNAPALRTEAVKRPYTNQKTLEVSASDDLSGIDKVVYTKIDAATNQVLAKDEELDLSWEIEDLVGKLDLAEGFYHLHLTAYDSAGNQTLVELNNLQVDQTTPELDGIYIDLVESGGRYLTSNGTIPLRFTATDDFSKISGLHYRYRHNGELIGKVGFIALSPTLQEFAHSLPLTGENGKAYGLELVVEDRAGNRSAVINAGTVFIDQSPPQILLEVEGVIAYGSNHYLTDQSMITAVATGTDEESQVDTVEYAIRAQENGELITSWGGWPEVIETVSLTKGQKYQVAARAVNGVGLEKETYSPVFIYEPTGPEELGLTGPAGEVVSGEPATFILEAVEAESTIVEYRLAIGSSPGEIDLSEKIAGNINGRLVLRTNEQYAEIRVMIPEGISDGTYYPQVEVVNAAGLKSALDGEGFVVNNTQEKVIVGDQGPYTMHDHQLTGWWKYTGTQEIAGYRYRIIGPTNLPVTAWTETEQTEETVEDLTLENGMEYRFEAQVIFTSGEAAVSGVSPGVKVDTTAPVITELLTPEYAVSDRIEVEWKGNDDESGLSKVEVALGSDYYLTDLTGGWMEVTGESFRFSSDRNGERLNLQNGERYYLTLRLTNGAGLVVEKPAHSITIDDTPPPVPVICDQGAYINNKQPLEFNWIWSPVDPESGNQDYKWAALEYGQDLEEAQWQEGNEDKKVILSDFLQEHGKTYYFAVEVTNGAGVSSCGLSDGIMVDATAPYIPRVKLYDAINLGDPDAEEITYLTGAQNELGLWMESMDPESQIAAYLYTWGSREEVDEKERRESLQAQIELIDQEFVSGEVTVFAGECVNNAQEASATGYSAGVMLDDSAPQVINVRGCVTGDLMYFDWDVLPSDSPVVKYEVALVTEENKETVPGADHWLDVGIARSIELDVSAEADGYYRLLVRAYNAAGTCSRREDSIDEWGVSPQIILDRTAPVIKRLNCPRFASAELRVEFEGEDALSGVKAYQYAFGSKTNPVQFTGGWIDLEQAGLVELMLETAELPHGAEAYFIARVKDNVGLWSAPRISEQIVIDHTPPEPPEITCGPYTTTLGMITGIGLSGYDEESGITAYLLSIVEEPGGEWLTNPEPQQMNEFGGALKGLELSEDSHYYLVAKVQNAAGLWSEESYSEMITVDTIPPEINFTLAGTEIVLNQPPISVEYTLSEEANLDFTLTKGDGSGVNYSLLGEVGIGHFTFEEIVPDTYTLACVPRDQAGNIGQEKVQTIRVNAPPEIHLPAEIKTTPGKPLILPATVVDPDGQIIDYTWIPGDGGAELTGAAPEYAYTANGKYTLTLTVKDNDGAVTSANTTVIVDNTTSGNLFSDEVWSGEHRLYGEVIVPKGINLTILPGTRLLIERGNGEIGYGYGLIIKGSFTAQGMDEMIVIGPGTGTPEYWQGIFVEGRAVLDQVTIRQAERGLTAINQADVVIMDCIFRDNEFGLHSFGAKPVVKDTQFIDNTLYAIKEDEGGRPVVIDCYFAGNGILYYHEALTFLTIDELNQIEGNNGNHE